MTKVAAVALLLFSAAVTLRADHAPEWLLARRSTAPRVLRLVLDETTLREVIRRWGKPASQKTDEKFPEFADYTWHTGGLTITVGTIFPPAKRSPDRELAHNVEIRGAAGNERVLTEHGLRLGDDLQTLVQTYGWRYLTSWRRTEAGESAAVTFLFQDESELTAWFDDDGRIVRLFVAPGVE
jgi:hypothetical protein